jgi:hypothetical protein
MVEVTTCVLDPSHERRTDGLLRSFLIVVVEYLFDLNRCYDFKNIYAQKVVEKLAFLPKLQLVFAKNDYAIGY